MKIHFFAFFAILLVSFHIRAMETNLEKINIEDVTGKIINKVIKESKERLSCLKIALKENSPKEDKSEYEETMNLINEILEGVVEIKERTEQNVRYFPEHMKSLNLNACYKLCYTELLPLFSKMNLYESELL